MTAQTPSLPGAGMVANDVGGKAANLARMEALALDLGLDARVPRWTVIPADAFTREVADRGPWPASATEAEQRRREVLERELPDDLRRQILEMLARAGLGTSLLAVRSSAVGEDAAIASFAGQFDSVLGVRSAGDRADLWNAVRQVWSSVFSAHASAYRGRAESGSALPPARMAVILQEMVDPEAAGVAFAVDPVTGDRDTAIVSAVYGLGEGLVSGELDADTYRVSFSGDEARAVEAELATKDRAVRLTREGGTRTEPVDAALVRAPALTDDEAKTIAESARRLSSALGAPQDIEWAMAREGGACRLVLLQTRPITTLGKARKGERRIWDNSNIVESYGGVTTPLTFSFARYVYEDVYQQFCRLMGVPEPLIESHGPVFAHMLGLVRGRVYYNLLNWYRVLALLPGFSFNRAFMERMMGVREKLEDAPTPPSAGDRLTDFARLLRMIGRMVRENGRLAREVPAFQARVEAALGPLAREDLGALPPERLLGLYRRLEVELLQHWRAPLVNDFFAMVYFGVLGRLIEKWLLGAPPTLVNDLLCGEGGIISTEPARRVMALASQVTASPALQQAFAAEPDDHALWRRLDVEIPFAAFRRQLAAYVEKFGDRCMNELKLETVTLGEDPSFLLQMVRAYASQKMTDPDAARAREVAIREKAERTVRERLSGPRLALFLWVLRNARARVRDRENLRFERTRVFGIVRRIFVALGGHLARANRLDSARDVFFLTREELFAASDGTAVTHDLGALVAARRAEFAAYETGPAPPDRFETWGVPDDGPIPAPAVAATTAAADGSTLQGTGCCPGIVRARVRVVRDPREAKDLAGHILVAERTDPGWTLLFPASLGLLVQRGSLLSHSAIVAREMGLPCVVGVAGLLDTLRDDELVEMDGTSGVIQRLEPGPA